MRAMSEDLWSPIRTERRAKAAPLAVRVRPRTLDEIAGQQHCLAPGSLLRSLIEQDALAVATAPAPDLVAEALAWGNRVTAINLQRAGCQPPWRHEV